MKYILLLLTCFLLFSCNSENEYTIFIREISKYPSYNQELDYLYYDEYKKTKSYVLALNNVNYPDFYTSASNQIMFDGIILINKLHGVTNSFIPDNLVTVENVPYINRPNETMLINKQALLNYKEMVQDAKNQDINLVIFSAYRTYDKQLSLWNDVPSFDNLYLAVPGYSEHHTGLAIDISTLENGLTKEKNKALEVSMKK